MRDELIKGNWQNYRYKDWNIISKTKIDPSYIFRMKESVGGWKREVSIPKNANELLICLVLKTCWSYSFQAPTTIKSHKLGIFIISYHVFLILIQLLHPVSPKTIKHSFGKGWMYFFQHFRFSMAIVNNVCRNQSGNGYVYWIRIQVQ